MKRDANVPARLDRILREDSAEKRGFQERIERARALPFERLDQGLEPASPTQPESTVKATSTKDASPQAELAVAPAETSGHPLFQALHEEIGEATNFTLGIVTLSARDLAPEHSGCHLPPRHPLSTLIEELAHSLNRRTCCIHVGTRSRENDKASCLHFSSQSQVAYRHWDIQISKRHREFSQGLDLQSHLHQLPHFKKQYPLVVMELGKVDQPWTESLARLCDAVYLAIPNMGALQPLKAVASIRRLKQAHVRVSGSWIVRAA